VLAVHQSVLLESVDRHISVLLTPTVGIDPVDSANLFTAT
jgi:hypothetical protein